jgi:pyruvate dehydrogenase E2 component (dihydrolipoamide acetyltransferase)
MLRSRRETASVTLTTSIDASNLVGLRAQFKAVTSRQESGTPPPIGYSDIAIKLVALALAQHPLLNSSWDGERILIFRNIHIGLAVDTEAGLLVPVIRDVPSLTLRQVAARVRDLVDRARRRGLTADELQGGTFTITNLGPFGVDAFTPIINPPQCAVLGLGRIVADQHAPGSSAATRHRMSLSLTFDHRIVDGAPAARFLQTLASLLEVPSPWLVS